MLIFTAWADLLFFLISVNFRICLSSRLTPFLELPWNLKNKTRNYHWKKSRRPIGSRKATHARWSLRVGPEGAPGVGRGVQLCPQLPHVDTQLPQPPSPRMAVITHTSQRKALPLQRLTDTRDVDTLAEHTVWNSFCLERSDRYIAQCHTYRPPGEGFRCSYTWLIWCINSKLWFILQLIQCLKRVGRLLGNKGVRLEMKEMPKESWSDQLLGVAAFHLCVLTAAEEQTQHSSYFTGEKRHWRQRTFQSTTTTTTS